MLQYVVITPARNESRHMSGLIESMVAQTRRPVRWVIVSDASTDGTDEIVESYRRQFDWIDLVRMPEKRDRSFAAKVSCVNAGLERLAQLPYDIIASLDADITFPADYFAYLLERFEQMPRLGVAGTPFVEDGGGHYDYRFTNIEHVSGACQVFRRECFQEIGGYVPIRGGGIDWVAVSTARMKRWQTRTFTERVCEHHRPMGTGSAGRITSIFRHGRKDYYLGGHPLWQLFRATYQSAHPPYIVGGFCLLAGYLWAALSGTERKVSVELMRFHRAEQMARLRGFFMKSRATA
jgi:poly-beta-1,6-N-acetyl-D-glucosamine synthase